tara:strand:+ start:252 stop:752 length:501 start_codon:yes stop_codon:yes gene_type:complete
MDFIKYITEFQYPVNTNRLKVKVDNADTHRGMALGLVSIRPKDRIDGVEKRICRKVISQPKYKKCFENTCEWFDRAYPFTFKYSTIQYNSNIKCAKHIDNNNVGESIIVGLGDYEGGELIVYDKDDNPRYIDIKNKFYKFNGSEYYHATNDFTGNRVTMVFFNIAD